MLHSPRVLPYLLSKNFMTRKLSPSFNPRFRSSTGVMPGIFSSPIASLLNAAAYLSQICRATPHWRKKSNQSYSGFFVCSILAPAGGTFFCDRFLLISARSFSSSRDSPVAFSTYSRSSMDILVTGTAILTPFSLCRWILLSRRPINSASTLNEPDRSVHVRTFDLLGTT